MNAELLRETVRAMEMNQDSNMDKWFCGTAGCLAGTRAILDCVADQLRCNAVCMPGDTKQHIADWAQERFELPDPRLFLTVYWPIELQRRYHFAAVLENQAEMMAVVRDAVENYIATDGWPQQRPKLVWRPFRGDQLPFTVLPPEELAHARIPAPGPGAVEDAPSLLPAEETVHA